MTQIDWDLLTRYLAGGGTPAERQWVERMARSRPELHDLITAVREIARDDDPVLSRTELFTRLEVLKQEKPRAASATLPRPPRFLMIGPNRSWVGVAAALVVLAGGAWLEFGPGWSDGSLPRPPAYSVVSAARGQRISLRLEDGSLATLAPGSSLRTQADYGRHDRLVELTGEAVFTVVHDAARPFRVRMAGAEVTDLGTRFDVRAYPGDSVTEIVVAEGRVAVRPDDQVGPLAARDSLVVWPHQLLRLAGTEMRLTQGIDLAEYFDWTDGRLVFHAIPLRVVLARLTAWYDVPFELADDTLGDRLLTASFDNQPLPDVLQLLGLTLGLRFEPRGQVMVVHSRRARGA